MDDHYESLGVEPTASQSEIRAAYRELAKRYHPDQNPSRIATRLMRTIPYSLNVIRDVEEHDVALRFLLGDDKRRSVRRPRHAADPYEYRQFHESTKWRGRVGFDDPD